MIRNRFFFPFPLENLPLVKSDLLVVVIVNELRIYPPLSVLLITRKMVSWMNCVLLPKGWGGGGGEYRDFFYYYSLKKPFILSRTDVLVCLCRC